MYERHYQLTGFNPEKQPASNKRAGQAFRSNKQLNQIDMELTSIYKGGNTADSVREQIKQRFGEKEAQEYDPKKNCFTAKGWIQRGFIVKKGERGLLSYTIIEKEVDHEKVSYKKAVFLFAKCQVKKIN